MLQKAIVQTCFILSVLLLSALSCESLTNNDTEKYALQKQFDLPDELAESSGIIFYNSLIWTFNDGGNEAAVYGLDTETGEIKQTVMLAQVENKDWEDITQDEDFIYIGDFGNNAGDRKDLIVYKISKSLISNEIEQEIHPIEIAFEYEDQTDFSTNANATSYDCEAFIVKGDSLILFTKDWINNTTTLYRIPKFEGSYVAVKSGSFNSKGLVTGAASGTGKVVLCGYTSYIPFVISINHGDTVDLHMAPRQQFQMIEQTGYQFEGIALEKDRIYLTAERSATIQACWEFIEK